MQTFVYLIRPTRPGFAPDAMTPEEAHTMRMHFQYLKKALEEGRLILAGPCLDAAFGVAIYEAESEEAAREFMLNDPAVKEGVMRPELHPYRVSLWRAGEVNA